MSIWRRQFLQGISAAALLGLRPAFAAGSSLGDIAAQKGILYGTAVRSRFLSTNLAYANLIARECRIVVGEGELKWDTTGQTKFHENYGAAEILYRFCASHLIALRGHTLLWNRALPKWADTGNSKTLRKVVMEHVVTTVKAWKGRVPQWDVANEILDPKWPDGLSREQYWKALGVDFVAEAFKTVRSIDPKVMLFYNDDNFGMDQPSLRSNRIDTAFKLFEKLHARGATVDALGVQGHLRIDRQPMPSEIRRMMQMVEAAGMKAAVTELDVRDNYLRQPASDAQKSDCLKRYLEPILGSKSTVALLTWGISDAYSWLNTEPMVKRQDGKSANGLPFDASYRPTAVYQALADLFQQAPLR